MADPNHADLRALAAAADPGNWVEADDPEIAAGAWPGNGVWTFGYLTNALGGSDADNRYVSAVSPDVVVGLLDEINRLRAIVEVARSDHAAHLWSLSATASCYADQTMLDEAATRADPGEA